MTTRTVPVLSQRTRIGIVVVVATFLFVTSVIPIPGATGSKGGDGATGFAIFALLHIVGYATLTLVMAYAVVDVDGPSRLILPTIGFIAVLFGAGIEVVQGQLDYRTFSVLDIWLNAFGVVIALGIWLPIRSICSFESKSG